ncbi:hypothetical protein [Eudoraea adriatica]|uniref:hypothetical protein n=1 Tax=Eudoraea adriatica TaxID=446681 RepID=UPI0012FAE77B|nr:hypothetical protein [Eudoraea adriatica]
MIALMSFALVIVSCSDGDTGPAGPAGPAGAAGPTGPAGADGADGAAGADGVDGVDGVDGNANVQNITFDASTFEGTFDQVTITQLTQDVLDNDGILVYLNDGIRWFPVPCPADSFGFPFGVDVNLAVQLIIFDYVDGSGNNASIAAGDLDSGRVIIIESTTTTSGKTSQQQVYDRLREAGVNVNDYYAVCDFYDIAY